MTTLQEVLRAARKKVKQGDNKTGAKLLKKAADVLVSHDKLRQAAKIYEEAAQAYRQAYMADECYEALDKATLMLLRAGQDPTTRREIARINRLAGEIAEEAADHRKAAEFYFRAADFAESPEARQELAVKAADALENEADEREMKGELGETVALLKKVGRIYYSSGDEELGRRIYRRATDIAKRWAAEAEARQDHSEAASALADAAQILQMLGDLAEAVKLLMRAGELYERAGNFEKAGNTYDAAQELYKRERLTTARRKAMLKASEAYMQMTGTPEVVAPLLVKAGEMFTEAGSPVKAKWAYKRAAEMFHQLAERAKKDGDDDSRYKYLQYEAMSLKKWGANKDAQELYDHVISYYLERAEQHEKKQEHEMQAMRLKEAAEVLYEMGEIERANAVLEEALEIYIQLAEMTQENGDTENSSRYYSKAAECARLMADIDRWSGFHWIASKKAEYVARGYEREGIIPLAAVWKRTAAHEALKTNEDHLRRHAVELLNESSQNFKQMGELKEAFKDLLLMFVLTCRDSPHNDDALESIVNEMQKIVVLTGDEYMRAILAVLVPIQRSDYLIATMALQEHEKVIGADVPQLREVIESRKRVDKKHQ